MTNRIRFEEAKLTEADEAMIADVAESTLKKTDLPTALLCTTIYRTFTELAHRQSAIMDKLELLEDKLNKLNRLSKPERSRIIPINR